MGAFETLEKMDEDSRKKEQVIEERKLVALEKQIRKNRFLLSIGSRALLDFINDCCNEFRARPLSCTVWCMPTEKFTRKVGDFLNQRMPNRTTDECGTTVCNMLIEAYIKADIIRKVLYTERRYLFDEVVPGIAMTRPMMKFYEKDFNPEPFSDDPIIENVAMSYDEVVAQLSEQGPNDPRLELVIGNPNAWVLIAFLTLRFFSDENEVEYSTYGGMTIFDKYDSVLLYQRLLKLLNWDPTITKPHIYERWERMLDELNDSQALILVEDKQKFISRGVGPGPKIYHELYALREHMAVTLVTFD